MNKQTVFATVAIIILAALLLLGSRFFVSVPAGHVAVATLFGDVRDEPYEEGLHIPVNPLYEFTNRSHQIQHTLAGHPTFKSTLGRQLIRQSIRQGIRKRHAQLKDIDPRLDQLTAGSQRSLKIRIAGTEVGHKTGAIFFLRRGKGSCDTG
jgi:hypothetical protein